MGYRQQHRLQSSKEHNPGADNYVAWVGGRVPVTLAVGISFSSTLTTVVVGFSGEVPEEGFAFAQTPHTVAPPLSQPASQSCTAPTRVPDAHTRYTTKTRVIDWSGS